MRHIGVSRDVAWEQKGVVGVVSRKEQPKSKRGVDRRAGQG